MATAEQMAISIRLEKHGVFVLLWDAKEDLVRALLILDAALSDIPKRALLVAPSSQAMSEVRTLIQTRVRLFESSEQAEQPAKSTASELWLFFLQQASSETIGPLLNGWRSLLRQTPGTIMIIRHGDFSHFQNAAPDLASFIGPRIYNASNLLSLYSEDTNSRIKTTLPSEWVTVLNGLPGATPSDESINEWVLGN